MRVLHVHCRYREAGGEDVAVDAERRLLVDQGFDVVPYDAENPDAAVASAAELLFAPWNPATYREFSGLARRVRPDVVHVHNTWYALSPSILEALHRSGSPVVMTVHNYRLSCANCLFFRDGRPCTDCMGKGTWRGVVHRCYRSSALASAMAASTITVNRWLGTWRRCVDRFLVLNGLAHQALVSSGIPAENLQRSANFVVDPGLRPAVPSASSTILNVGRLSHEKGLDMMLEAWRRWRPQEAWSLVVAGDGPLRGELEALADHRVTFLGQVSRDRVHALMHDARALVLPSLVFEGQPMVALEAFAAGLGVLGRDIGGTGEVLRPLGPQWAVSEAEPQAWTDALDVVASDVQVDAAGRASRGAYEERYSTAAAATRLQVLYEQLVARATASTLNVT